jgi:hypothetical protein
MVVSLRFIPGMYSVNFQLSRRGDLHHDKLDQLITTPLQALSSLERSYHLHLKSY